MLSDSLICDYNYKCLDFHPKTLTYTSCPHDKTCDIRNAIHNHSRKHYSRHVNSKKEKKGYNDTNPSVPEIKALYKESLLSGFICPYCNSPMTLERNFLNSSTIDHKEARSLGGTTEKKNMVLCCTQCNRDKSRLEIIKLESMKTQRKCSICGEMKSVGEFYKKKSQCNDCIAEGIVRKRSSSNQ